MGPETAAREVDPVDLDEEQNQDEEVWNEFADQIEAKPAEPESPPEPEPEEPSAEAPGAPPAEEPELEPEPEATAEPATEKPAEPVLAEPETTPEPAPKPEPAPAPQFAPAAVQAVSEPPLTDAQRRERIVGLRKAAMEEAERLYALDEETGNTLLESPGKVLPQLAAQVQLTTQEVVINEVMRMLPMAVAMEIERRDNAGAFWNEFETEWPKLSGRRQELTQLASTYQAMNPQADRARIIRDVGASAMLAFRIPVEIAQVPESPPRETPPPAPVTGARPASPAPRLGMFEQYAAELEDDDDA